VLIRWDDEIAFRRVAHRYQLDPVRTAAVLRALRPGLQSGRRTLHEFWCRFAQEVDRPVPEDWRTLWVSELARGARPRRPVQRLADDLRRAGVRTGLFSNTDSSHWKFFRASGWLDGFSPVIPSFRIGTVKPHLLAFQRASLRLPAGSGPPVFIDDHPVNVAAARRLGWDPLLFSSVRTLRDELEARGLFD